MYVEKNNLMKSSLNYVYNYYMQKYLQSTYGHMFLICKYF